VVYKITTIQIVWVREEEDGSVDIDHLEDMLKVLLTV
jgi:glycine cleavage system protein P-like pyridoxal-binding family